MIKNQESRIKPLLLSFSTAAILMLSQPIAACNTSGDCGTDSDCCSGYSCNFIQVSANPQCESDSVSTPSGKTKPNSRSKASVEGKSKW